MRHTVPRGGARYPAPLTGLLVTGLVALGGCPGDPTLGGDSDMGGGGDLASAPSDVTGTAIDTYVTATGSQQRPRDLTGTDVAVFFESSPGNFDRIQGTGSADGTFRVPAVPAGTYTLKLGSAHLVTSRRNLDVGVAFMGRPDRARASVSPTVMQLNVGQMDPWSVTDGLAMHAANVGAGTSLADVLLSPRPVVGAQAAQGALNWAAISSPYLIDGQKGDRLQLLHLAGRNSGTGVTYQRVTQIFNAPAFTLGDGGTATLTGAFEAVAQDRKLKVDWSRSQFEGLRGSVHPLAQSFSHSFQLFAYPQAQAHGDYGAGALLAAMYPTPDATDLDAGELSFGNPFPADWTLMASAGVTFVVPYQIPGASAAGAPGAIYVLSDDKQVAAGPVRPLVGPVSKPQVNGKDAFGSLSGVGLYPVLSWSPPAVGSASGYQVFVYRLFADGGATRRTLVTSLRTTATRLTLPPNVLDRGSAYTATIVAINRPGADLDASPFRRGLPEGGAATLLGAFAP